MADEADLAQETEQMFNDRAINAARDEAMKIPPGTPGDCDLCGEWFSRLVDGECGGCRDRRRPS